MSAPALSAPPPPVDWAAQQAALLERIAQLEYQLAWFRRQPFGEKSERRHGAPPPEQLSLGDGLGEVPEAPVPTQPVVAHRRRPATKGEEPALFFDPERVPVEVIPVPNPEMQGLAEDAYVVIGEKVTHRAGAAPG